MPYQRSLRTAARSVALEAYEQEQEDALSLALIRTVSDMSDIERLIMGLVRVEQLRCHEVALMLSISSENVDSIYQRGLAKLRGALLHKESSM